MPGSSLLPIERRKDSFYKGYPISSHYLKNPNISINNKTTTNNPVNTHGTKKILARILSNLVVCLYSRSASACSIPKAALFRHRPYFSGNAKTMAALKISQPLKNSNPRESLTSGFFLSFRTVICPKIKKRTQASMDMEQTMAHKNDSRLILYLTIS